MTGLPEGWDDVDGPRALIHRIEASGCCIWLGEYKVCSWEEARRWILHAAGRSDDRSPCAITPACVNPTHSRSTRRPAGGGVA